MYNRARRTAAGIMADICSAGSLEAAERLRAELYGESGNVFVGDSDVRRHIPNRITGLMLSSVNELLAALKSGSYELAGDIAGIISSLPDETLLADRDMMREFYRTRIMELNRKYGREILPYDKNI